MKMKYFYLFLILLFAGVLNPASAQDTQTMYKGRFTISGGVGASLMPGLYHNFNNLQVDYGKIKPVFIFSADYYLIELISVGLSFGYQNVHFIETRNNYNPGGGGYVKTDIDISLTRMNFAYHILFHYYRSKNISVYSGVSMGMNYHSITDNSSDPSFQPTTDPFLEFGFAPRLIGLGLDLYVFQDLAINTEIGIGYPSFMTFGLRYDL
jgi:hypothetical protein